jgi:hypothetical protein
MHGKLLPKKRLKTLITVKVAIIVEVLQKLFYDKSYFYKSFTKVECFDNFVIQYIHIDVFFHFIIYKFLQAFITDIKLYRRRTSIFLPFYQNNIY